MAQPIFLNAPQKRPNQFGQALAILTEAITKKKQGQQLADTLTAIQGISEPAPTQASQNIFTSTPTPLAPEQELAPGVEGPLQQDTNQQIVQNVPGRSRVEIREETRRKAYAAALKAPASKQEALFKAIDRQFPKIEPVMVEVTRPDGSQAKLPENHPDILSGAVRVGGLTREERISEKQAGQKPTKEKNKVIKYTKVVDGKPVPTEVLVPESEYNAKVKEIEDAGGIVSQKKPGFSITTPDGTVISYGGEGNLNKATKTQLEKDIIMAKDNLSSFSETGKLFKDEYLTYFGKGEKFIASLADKAGMASDEQKALIKERAAWFRQAKADFIAYRKWATGVAGGEKELREIATAFPDPVKNSPEEYKANLASIDDTTRRVLELNENYLRSGTVFGKPEEQEAQSELQTITTQEAYDALPSGAVYLEDGVKYRKP